MFQLWFFRAQNMLAGCFFQNMFGLICNNSRFSQIYTNIILSPWTGGKDRKLASFPWKKSTHFPLIFPGERLVPRPGSAGARFGGGGSKHRRSTWKRVNDPKRSDFGSIIVGIYPLPSNSNSGGWKVYNVYWCLLESPGEHVIRCMFCSSNANGHGIIDRNSSAQRGRLEHSKCQTECWNVLDMYLIRSLHGIQCAFSSKLPIFWSWATCCSGSKLI